MHAQKTNHSPPVDVVKAAAVRLAPLLMRAGLNVTVNSVGVVETRNPGDARMRQPLVLREHQGRMWWCWVWSGPTRDAPPEYERMVPVDDLDEAARRIVNVLTIGEAER